MNTKQNKLGTYLAVTARAGCAASIAEGAIQVVDLSGFSVAPDATLAFPASTGDTTIDLSIPASGTTGFLSVSIGYFYSDSPGLGYDGSARGYASGPADFPSDPDFYTMWNFFGNTTDSGFSVGTNWVAFKDSADNFGWMSFTLNSLAPNNSTPVSSYGVFVYDDTSTSPANAIPLETAIAAVPEPSGLALLALGSVGLATRRRRKTP